MKEGKVKEFDVNKKGDAKNTGVLQLKVKIKLHVVVIAKNYSVRQKYTANFFLGILNPR